MTPRNGPIYRHRKHTLGERTQDDFALIGVEESGTSSCVYVKIRYVFINWNICYSEMMELRGLSS